MSLVVLYGTGLFSDEMTEKAGCPRPPVSGNAAGLLRLAP